MSTIKEDIVMKENILKRQRAQEMSQPRWQRTTLLIILGYEAVGCLLGGSLLVAAPDGRYMSMPVDMMHNVFRDFLFPGIILFGLGVLNTLAFFAVLRRTFSDWFMSGIALGGLFIWFVVEIIILQELHWLHLMWGLPVLMGWVVAIPLIVLRHDTATTRRALLTCGILSSLWYVAVNIIVLMMYDGYNMVAHTVSELSAIGAPTRIAWVLLAAPYPLLVAAFGWGVLRSADKSRRLRVAGSLIIAYSIANLYWPPMHQREVIAAGEGTLTDTFHIVWTVITLLFMMLLMGSGATALGKRFRVYTFVTWVIFVVFGVLSGIASGGIQANQPTPLIGVWERINIGAFMLWVMVFAIVLLRRERRQAAEQI